MCVAAEFRKVVAAGVKGKFKRLYSRLDHWSSAFRFCAPITLDRREKELFTFSAEVDRVVRKQIIDIKVIFFSNSDISLLEVKSKLLHIIVQWCSCFQAFHIALKNSVPAFI